MIFIFIDLNIKMEEEIPAGLLWTANLWKSAGNKDCF